MKYIAIINVYKRNAHLASFPITKGRADVRCVYILKQNDVSVFDTFDALCSCRSQIPFLAVSCNVTARIHFYDTRDGRPDTFEDNRSEFVMRSCTNRPGHFRNAQEIRRRIAESKYLADCWL